MFRVLSNNFNINRNTSLRIRHGCWKCLCRFFSSLFCTAIIWYRIVLVSILATFIFCTVFQGYIFGQVYLVPDRLGFIFGSHNFVPFVLIPQISDSNIPSETSGFIFDGSVSLQWFFLAAILNSYKAVCFIYDRNGIYQADIPHHDWRLLLIFLFFSHSTHYDYLILLPTRSKDQIIRRSPVFRRSSDRSRDI